MMDDITNKNTNTLGKVFAKVYSLTILGVSVSFGIGYILKDIWSYLIMQDSSVLLGVGLIFSAAIFIFRSNWKITNAPLFFIARVFDAIFFSSIFWIIDVFSEIVSLHDLTISVLVGILLFAVAGISSLFIKRSTYNVIAFHLSLAFKIYAVLVLIDLLLFLIGKGITFINKLGSYFAITSSMFFISIVNKSIIENGNLNIWHSSDILSSALLTMIRHVFNLILHHKIRNKKK